MTDGNPTPPPWWQPESWKPRDVALFSVGVTFATNEVFFATTPRRDVMLVSVIFMLGPVWAQPLISALVGLVNRIFGLK